MKRAQSPTLPPVSLVALCLVLVLASVPLWDQAPFWTPLLLTACAAWRVTAIRQPGLLLSTPWRLVLLAAASAGIWLKSRTFFDVEPGFGVLLVLISLKVLETRTRRDFLVLTLLGLFLCLCSLFLSQELARWLFVGVMLTLVCAVTVHLHVGGKWQALPRALRRAGTMMGQALPLTVLLFLFVPRPPGDFRVFPGTSRRSIAAMSDKMSPGSIAGMAAQPNRAFRAAFPNLATFPQPPYYWRGLVLWAGDGLNWERGGRLRTEGREESARGPLVRQYITLEPHGNTWLFALDRPVSQPKESRFEPGGTLRSLKPINSSYSYEVTSQLGNNELTLSPDHLAAALLKPSRISPQVQALADSFRAGAADDGQVVQRALAFFRQGNFTYSYTPGTYSSSELDEFLFRRRMGFCEHYAGAFATLMRIAGVPSRVVIGYLGGEESHYGRYIIVNQSDAHAWCEVWLPGRGWVRQDPTSAAAPDRANYGLYNYLAAQRTAVPGGPSVGGSAWYSWNLLREARLLWDGLTYQWDLRVLTFNRDNQQDFFMLLGLNAWRWGQWFVAIAFACVPLVGALAWWMRHPRRRSTDRAQQLFDRFCRRVAAAGLPRVAAEGPLAFTERAAARFPAAASQIRQVGEVYIAIRYGKQGPPLRRLAEVVREVGRPR